MKFLRKEEAVSEVIGAMLILLILVLYLGLLQVYEVPKWNKELEREHFDKVYNDFVDFRSDLEDVSILNIPKTSSMHMGIRYPERFMLRNQGPGAYGTLSAYPLNINVSYKSADGSFSYYNYTSRGITYKLNGLSIFPKLVYEHGIIIKDFGDANITDDEQGLVVNGNIFIPLVNIGSISESSMETESINIKPYITSIANIKYISITMDTQYPTVWKGLLNGTQANVSGDKITINLSSFIERDLLFPTAVPTTDTIYTNMIRFRTSSGSLGVPPFSNSDPSQPNWPAITNINLEAVNTGSKAYKKTHSNITITVNNVTGPSYIHADLTGLTRDIDPLAYNVHPDYFLTSNWNLPNSNTVRWSFVEHPDYHNDDIVSIKLWVVNPDNNMQYYTERTFTGKED